MLESGETDLLLFPDLGDTRFETTTVAEEEVVVALPAGHPLASRPAIRPADLQGQPFVHFTPENRLGTWIESHLADLDLRETVVFRTAITTHAPQLAAAGLGVTVVPVSAISAGFPGAVRPLEPRWTRRLVATTPTPRDPLAEKLTGDLRRSGLQVPDDIARQLSRAEDGQPLSGGLSRACLLGRRPWRVAADDLDGIAARDRLNAYEAGHVSRPDNADSAH
jgi:DNA-binding transcriptional LysR family regulator